MKTGSMRSTPTQFGRSRCGFDAGGLPQRATYFWTDALCLVHSDDHVGHDEERVFLLRRGENPVESPSEVSGGGAGESPMGLERWPSG